MGLRETFMAKASQNFSNLPYAQYPAESAGLLDNNEIFICNFVDNYLPKVRPVKVLII